METEPTTETEVADTTTEETQAETISVSKSDYEKLNQTLGSLKRELKDLKKPKEEPKTEPKSESGLLQKSYLRAAGINAPDEVELALATAQKWGVEVDALVDDEDFQAKLEKLRTAKTNATATSNIKGGSGPSQAKNTLEYWQAKGTPPTPADVPNNATRRAIVTGMLKNAGTNGKVFYND